MVAVAITLQRLRSLRIVLGLIHYLVVVTTLGSTVSFLHHLMTESAVATTAFIVVLETLQSVLIDIVGAVMHSVHTYPINYIIQYIYKLLLTLFLPYHTGRLTFVRNQV